VRESKISSTSFILNFSAYVRTYKWLRILSALHSEREMLERKAPPLFILEKTALV